MSLLKISTANNLLWILKNNNYIKMAK